MANTDANSQSMSNNHISSQPCTSQTEVEGKGSSDTPLDHDVVFEETREVLKRFLVKHLSREAINVTPDSQYEGIFSSVFLSLARVICDEFNHNVKWKNILRKVIGN